MLVLCNSNGTDSFLNIREGVTQGDSLAMITYGIDILLIFKSSKRSYLKSLSSGKQTTPEHWIHFQESRLILICWNDKARDAGSIPKRQKMY